MIKGECVGQNRKIVKPDSASVGISPDLTGPHEIALAEGCQSRIVNAAARFDGPEPKELFDEASLWVSQSLQGVSHFVDSRWGIQRQRRAALGEWRPERFAHPQHVGLASNV